MDKIKKVAVIGAGLMGSGIAQVCAQSGYKVMLNDVNLKIVNQGYTGITERWNSKKERGKIDAQTFSSYLDNLMATSDLREAVSDADIVIEAIVEKIDIKTSLLQQVDSLVRPDTIIASNTSSISISTLASKVSNPERFIGLHFFSPVPVMKLLEIIPGFVTSEEIYAIARDFGESLGKVCITCKDTHGFIVNRLLDPMANEAIRMLDEGVGTVEDIDNGMKYGCGHPMGPFELVDMAGIDLLLMVMEVFHRDTGNRDYNPANLLRKMVEAGYTGKKAGIGFYVYHEDGTKTVNPVFDKTWRK